MADFLEFLPLFQENITTIRARLDADINAGLDPNDPAFLDTTEGGIWFDLSQVIALEQERMWDALASEVPAALFPAYAWGDYLDEHGVTINLPRKDAVTATGTVTFTGTNGTLISSGTKVATVQIDPDADPVIFTTTASATIAAGTATVPIVSDSPGSAGNVPSGTITTLISPLDGIASLTNANATSGGADVETDDLYSQRILLEYAGPHGGGTVADYQRWALAYPPVGYVTVDPLWSGAGTVRVVVTDQSNNPVSGSVLTGLQTLLDPVAGQGQGLAPVGATVTVVSPTVSTITVSATVSLLTGYTLDGTGGTIAVRTSIVSAIKAYIDKLKPGDDVIRERVASTFFSVDGVYDVSSVLLNGAASNVTLTSLQVARTGTVTLT